MALCSVIRASGSFIPSVMVPNTSFREHEFYDINKNRIEVSGDEIISKFHKITNISERRYAENNLVTSDMGYLAAKECLESGGIDMESLDYIIFAHNFGDIRADNRKSDFVPSLAARVKHKLKIVNPSTVAYDLPFGCPGWLMGVIQAHLFIKAGAAKKILVIGGETLSRVSDPHDRDSMLYADGAGAVVIEAVESDENIGILSYAVRSDTLEHAYMLWMGESSNPSHKGDELFLKMKGHSLYEYALATVPLCIKDSLDKAGMHITDVTKLALHQANEKMDERITRNTLQLYGVKPTPEMIAKVMPMTISWLGNTSVATLPTLYDLMSKDKIEEHTLDKGNIIVFVSVGAGMNVNSVVYRV
jgi:3-oxoacyl-[acyl-carrier-protein] synthase-3